jgi:hypothetical protein
MKKMIERATVADAEEILSLQKQGDKIFKMAKANDRLTGTCPASPAF